MKSNDIISFNDPTTRIFCFENCYQETYGLPDEVFNRYYIGRELGSGAQGMVRLVINRTSCDSFAMKQVSKHGSSTTLGNLNDERINREITIMTNLNHTNIMRCHDVIITQKAVYMVRPKRSLKSKKGNNLFLL